MLTYCIVSKWTNKSDEQKTESAQEQIVFKDDIQENLKHSSGKT